MAILADGAVGENPHTSRSRQDRRPVDPMVGVLMLDHGLCVTVNSDDPAYFGGYVGENLAGVVDALQLDDAALVQLARNSFEAAFLDDAVRARHLAELDAAHS